MQSYLVTRGNSDIRRVVQPYGMSSEITFEARPANTARFFCVDAQKRFILSKKHHRPAKKSIFLWDGLSHNTAKQ